MVEREPFIVKNLIPTALLRKLVKLSEIYKTKKELIKIDENQCERIWLPNEKFGRFLHQSVITPRAKEMLGENISPSFCLLSLYSNRNAYCPPHYDYYDCDWTVNVCIGQNKVWPFFIASGFENDCTKDDLVQSQSLRDHFGKAYLLNPGDAVFYSSKNQPHWRNRLNDGDYCDLILFNFVIS